MSTKTIQKEEYSNLSSLRKFSQSLIREHNIKTEHDLYGEDGLIKKIQKDLYEALLEGELKHHLGYAKHEDSSGDNYRNGYSPKTIKTQHGAIELDIPRDRNGTFEPVIIEKHQRRTATIDSAVISLYSKGMSLNQISEQIKDLYQIELSEEQLSSITDSVIEEVSKWQSRPLPTIYPIVYLDGIYINVLDGKTVIKKVVYVALGVNLQGNKELLGLWICESEGAKFWLNVLTEMNNRGLKQVCIFCVDGLTGFPDAINAIYPKAMVQQCIVHAARRSLNYVSYKHKKKFAHDLKLVYGAKTLEEATNALDDLELSWSDQYPASIRLWRERWEYLSNFFQFPNDIRKAIYTTNAIESVNSGIRRIIKNKKSFPNDTAVFKVLFLALSDCAKKWTMPIKDWPLALNQFIIKFDLELNEINKN
jgi:putative transposase